jgi:hypothetical protein
MTPTPHSPHRSRLERVEGFFHDHPGFCLIQAQLVARVMVLRLTAHSGLRDFILLTILLQMLVLTAMLLLRYTRGGLTDRSGLLEHRRSVPAILSELFDRHRAFLFGKKMLLRI